MSQLPVTIAPRAMDDLRAIPSELRPAALEHLTRIGVNHETCSRRSAFPRPPGLTSGLWCRHASGSATLIEVLFFLTTDPDGITVRRVIVTTMDPPPAWVRDPTQWPIVDL